MQYATLSRFAVSLAGAILLTVALPVRAQHALRFTSADADQVLVPLPAPAADFTLEAWVKYTDVTYGGAHNTIVEFGNDDPYFGVLGTGSLELYLQQTSTPVTVSTNVWHHVACTFSRASRTVVLYLDGVTVGTNPASSLGVPGGLLWGSATTRAIPAGRASWTR